jgi:hypothetical protein
VDINDLIAYMSEQLKKLEEQWTKDGSGRLDAQLILERILPNFQEIVLKTGLLNGTHKGAGNKQSDNNNSNRADNNTNNIKPVFWKNDSDDDAESTDFQENEHWRKRPASAGSFVGKQNRDEFDSLNRSDKLSRSRGKDDLPIKEDELLRLVSDLVFEGVNTKADILTREMDIRMSDHDRSLKTLQNKLNNTMQQLRNDLTKKLDNKVDEETSNLLKQVKGLQEEIIRGQERDFKRMQLENKEEFRRMKAEMEDLHDMAKKAAVGLTQFKQSELEALVKKEVAKLMKFQIAEAVQDRLKDIEETQQLALEKLRSDWHTKLAEVQEKMKRESEVVKEELHERADRVARQMSSAPQSVVERIRDLEERLKHQVQVPAEERARMLENDVQALSSQVKETAEHDVDHEQRLTQLEELSLLQQQELENTAKQMLSLTDKLQERDVTTNLDFKRLETISKDWTDQLAQLENRIRTEERARTYLVEQQQSFKLKSLEDKLATLELQLQSAMEKARSESPLQTANSIRKLQVDIEQQNTDQLRAVQQQHKEDYDRLAKKLAEIAYRMGIVEEALKSEQETSLAALQALLEDD